MKCNIKYGVKIQEKNVIRCCICGEEIARQSAALQIDVAISATVNLLCRAELSE